MNGKATLFFEAGKYGWSESLYRVSADRADLKIAAQKLVLTRTEMLGTGADLTYIRCSDDDVFRDVEIVVTNGAAAKHFSSALIDVPWTGILVRQFCGDFSWRNQNYRGVPDEVVTNPWDPLAHADWVNKATAYFNQLKAGSWGNKAITRGGLNAPKDITDVITVLPAGRLQITTAVQLGASAGETIEFSGMKALQTPLKGRYQILQIDNPNRTFVIQLKPLQAVPVGVIKFGTVQRLTTSIVPFTDFVIRKPSSRKTGRPFDSPRGRSKVRR